ncbi:unnamed protein product [Trichogramma brassicae]|uniref:C2H2-type domain-containing protein n=1 Tax=Trichogramma brassicae TaxID=86971 RepID=A0A6H5I5E1_9HYME|nr:unnamed protein product [Trichogramma brassicae]
MLCGELLSGGLASAGALQAPYCGLLPGGLKNLGSPRPLTGSPYLALLVELLAAAAAQDDRDSYDDEDDEGEYKTRIMMMQQQQQQQQQQDGSGGPNNMKMPDRSELKLQLDGEHVDEDVLLDKSNLKRHIDVAHNGVSHTCDICEKKFSTKSNLKKHIDVAHNGVTHTYDICDRIRAQTIQLNQCSLGMNTCDAVMCLMCIF